MTRNARGPAPRHEPTFQVDTDHECPWGAGYSRDAKTVYIDHRIPLKLRIDGKSVNIHVPLAIHEETEKDLIDKHGLDYQAAHQLATLVEHGYLTQQGVDPAAYEKALKPFLEECEAAFSDVPESLDLTPYRDSKATVLIAKILAAQGRKGAK